MAKKEKVTNDQVDESEGPNTEATKVPDNSYTYVGGGEDSPRVINFMGLQKFVRGQLTEVTDPDVLKKLKNHPCFVPYEIEQEALHEADEEAKVAAENQRKEDQKINAAFHRKFKTE